MKNLAIVTSCFNYGQYIAEWADSILTLTRRPGRIAILQHGSTDDSYEQCSAAATRLRRAGLDVRLEQEQMRLNFGHARNRAVAMAGDVEWVMHFDCDDLILPHALEDIEKLAPSADVVCLGYERDYTLMGRNGTRTTKLYRTSTGATAVANSTPASGVSPFRRAFWLQAPYRTDLIGGWDTALWRAFGHLGARFVPTRRPAFRYRQHPDSIFNARRVSQWPAHRAGHQLTAAQRGDEGVTVVVPRATDDGPERAAAWDWLRRRYRALHGSWQVLEGMSRAGEWRKGEAVRRGLQGAKGRVLIIADADCLLPASALQEAVQRVERGAPWVVPHRLVHRLNQQATARLLASDPAAEHETPGHEALARRSYEGFPGGGVVVVNRAVYEASGGIPDTFVGWGAEDEALALILDTLVGPHERLEADLLHLWHPPQARRARPDFRLNRQLFERLRFHAKDPEMLWAMVRGVRAPHFRTASRADQAPDRAGPLGRPRSPSAKEVAMHDTFAQRRLSNARRAIGPNEESTPMAGPLNMKREYARRRREQEARNAEVEQQNRRPPRPNAIDADRAASDARREKAARPTIGEQAHERKMMDGAEENKQQTTDPERRTRRAPAREPQESKDPLEGVTFVSAAAADLARKEKLTAAQLKKANPGESKYTIAMVRAAAGE